ncbi:MAG: ParB/RepB/Spo0J family partition protein [Bdellovibrionales bacterium]|nr:ParB/RepB/Spo0J family partition protein [Bdellovibrionales bacterium]
MDKNSELNATESQQTTKPAEDSKIKTRQGSGYLKQLYSTARNTAGTTHSHLKNLTTFLVNFVPVEKVDASELQVRVHFDDSEVQALAHSIKEHGVLQPILVVQDGDRYKVIAGERRLRASKLAGMERIPARVLSTNDKATHEIALRENLDRVDLHPLEEGEGYLSLLEAQLYTSHDTIAKAFGKPKSRITECIGFTRLPEDTKAELLKRGLKNRSLLRQLLNIDQEKHLALIEEASAREEVLVDPQDGTTTKSSAANKLKKEPQPFQFEFEGDKLSVPSFKWKSTEGNQKLEGYLHTLRQLVEKLEDRLTQP